jgi:predicted metal-dependent phosphoesterase TrpH
LIEKNYLTWKDRKNIIKRMLIDMHIHTNFSACSVLDILQLLRRAWEAGLDGVCITDHDTVASKYILENICDKSGICIILGMEYTTSKGDFLVFGPVDYIPLQMEAEELCRWVERERGIAIPAHPFRKYRPADRGILRNSQVIEGLNGRNHPAENELCKDWLKTQGNGIREVGGSDAHSLEEVGRIATVFEKNIYCSEDLIRELRYGNYFPQRRAFCFT